MKSSCAAQKSLPLARTALCRLSAAIALITALAACSPQASEQELLSRARLAIDEGNARSALIDVKTALQDNPENAAARRLLGEIYVFQQNPATASEEFARSLTTLENTEVRVLYARSLLASGKGEELRQLHASGSFDSVNDNPQFLAILALAKAQVAEEDTLAAAQQLIDRALRLAPDDAYVATAHGFFLLRYMAAPEEAIESLQATVERFPEAADAWSLLGDVQQIHARYALAETSYAMAAKLNPHRLVDRLNLVSMRIEQGNSAGAQAALDPLIARYPNHPGVKFAEGRMRFAEGDYRGALNDFSAVLSSVPRHNGSLYLSAIANIHEGNQATAISQLNSLLALQPQHLNARLQLASLHMQMSQPEIAEELARSVLKVQDGNYLALAVLAAALSGQGLHDQSAEVYRQLVDAQPDNMESRLALGYELLLGGERELAIAEFKSTRAREPGSEVAWERLIQAELTNGDSAAASAEVQAFAKAFPNSSRPSLFLGQIAMQQNDLSAARGHFQQALALEPASIVANSGLAVLAASQSDLDQARTHYLDALAHHPKDTASLMNLAAIEQQRGDLGAMEGAITAAVESDIAALVPRLTLARFKLQENRSAEALPLLTALSDDYPREPDVWLLLGEALLTSGDLSAASDAARQLLELAPEDVRALSLAARVAYSRGSFAQSESYLAKAIKLQPDNADLRKLISDALVSQGKLPQASAMLDTLPQAIANEPAVLVAKGRVALARNLPGDAEPLLRSAMAAQPRAATLLWLSGAISSQGRADEAVALLDGWLADHPEDILVRSQLASLHLQLGREQEARLHYLTVLEKTPDNVLVLNNLSWLYRTDDPVRALGYIENANRLAPDDPRIKDTYAMIQLARGQFSEALILNDKALAAMPGNPQLRYHRAMILQADGQSAEAVRILKDILSKPDFAQTGEARELLASLQDL